MYEQQVSYLPNGMTPDKLYEHVEQTMKPKRIAIILHDKDTKEDNVTSFKIISDNENSEIENQQKKDLKEETSTVILNKNLDIALPKVKKEVPKSIELPAKKKNNEEVVHFSIIDNDK